MRRELLGPALLACLWLLAQAGGVQAAPGALQAVPGVPMGPGVPGAQGVPALPPPPGTDPQSGPTADWQSRATADLQALDKVDNRSTTLTVRVGQSAQFGRLTVAVRACVVRPPDQAQDAAAYLDITDPSVGAPGFHGWMLAAEPSVSMLEHPVYDVRVLGCH